MFARPTNELYPETVESGPYFDSLFLHDSFIILLSMPDLPVGISSMLFDQNFVSITHIPIELYALQISVDLVIC
jgi:hypothetical protein